MGTLALPDSMFPFPVISHKDFQNFLKLHESLLLIQFSCFILRVKNCIVFNRDLILASEMRLIFSTHRKKLVDYL